MMTNLWSAGSQSHKKVKLSLIGLAIIGLLLAACSGSKANVSTEPTRAAEATVTPLLPTASLAPTDITPKETSHDATPIPQTGSPPGERSQRYPTPGDYIDRISVKGQPRLFKLHIPYSYQPSEPAPLVLIFHGAGQEIEYLEAMSLMSPKADEAGFVAVYPQGLQQRWDIEPRNSGNLDVDFVQALIEHLESELSIDPSRIYAAGFSNGAGMAHRLACELSDKLAAIAPISGVYAHDLDCKPSRPVPVVAFQGTGDTFVPPQYAEHDTPLWAAGWAARNGCDSKPQTSFQKDNVTAETWSNCQANATVTLYTIEGGRHIWPGSPMAQQFFPDIQDIPATEVIWKFFEEHPMQLGE